MWANTNEFNAAPKSDTLELFSDYVLVLGIFPLAILHVVVLRLHTCTI